MSGMRPRWAAAVVAAAAASALGSHNPAIPSSLGCCLEGGCVLPVFSPRWGKGLPRDGGKGEGSGGDEAYREALPGLLRGRFAHAGPLRAPLRLRGAGDDDAGEESAKSKAKKKAKASPPSRILRRLDRADLSDHTFSALLDHPAVGMSKSRPGIDPLIWALGLTRSLHSASQLNRASTLNPTRPSRTSSGSGCWSRRLSRLALGRSKLPLWTTFQTQPRRRAWRCGLVRRGSLQHHTCSGLPHLWPPREDGRGMM